MDVVWQQMCGMLYKSSGSGDEISKIGHFYAPEQTCEHKQGCDAPLWFSRENVVHLSADKLMQGNFLINS